VEYNFIGQQEWPTNVVMPAAAQQFAEWSIGLLVAAFILWGIRNLIVRRDSALLICMIGGGVACVMEPPTPDAHVQILLSRSGPACFSGWL
jgi:hypothetical protein